MSDEITLPNPEDQQGDGFTEHSVELDVQRRLTHEFILTTPVYVVLTPREKVKQPSGGYKWEKQPDRDVQVVKLVEAAGITGGPTAPLRSSDGEMRKLEFMMVMEWDARVGRFDVFELSPGEWWEVAELYHFNGWERRAAVVRYG